MIKLQDSQKVRFWHEEIWDMPKKPFLMSGKLDEETGMPCFTLLVEMYEINCMVDEKSGKVKEGSMEDIIFKKYWLEIVLNPE